MSSPGEAIEVAERLSELPSVVWAEVDFTRRNRPKYVPSDPEFTNQWYLHNAGQGGGVTNRDVDARKAWDLTMGTSAVVVAILDDGFDLSHPDLAANVFINTNEYGGGKDSDGIDNDGNGYTNDWRGWNFVDNNNDPSPVTTNDNHGTAMAGLIVAAIDNATGVAGLAGRCRFLPIRVHTEGADISNSVWAAAIEYAAQFADVIAISYYLDPAGDIYNAFDYALVHGRGGKGCVICTALGNYGVFRRYSTDASTAPEVLVISGSSTYDKRSWFADYGPPLDLVCPSGGGKETDGSSFLVTTDRSSTNGWVTNDYVRVSGTSYGNAVAAGGAALVISRSPSLSGLEVRRIMEVSCDKIDAAAWPYGGRGWNERYGFGRMNVLAALNTTLPVWDKYESDDSAAGAAMITDGETQYRSLSLPTDLDWAKFVVSESEAKVRLTVLGTTSTWLRLYNSATNLIAEDGWGCPGYSYMTRTLSNGTYFVRVESSNNTAVPYYGLSLSKLIMPDSFEDDNTNSNARLISPRAMQYKTLYPAGDVDWAKFTLTIPTKVDIMTMGELDGWLELSLRNEGGEIGYDYKTNAVTLISTQLVAGTYWIKVNDALGYSVTSYQLLLETYEIDAYEVDDDTNAVAINSGENLIHTLYPTNDKDWVTFVLTNRANVLLMTDTINPYLNQNDCDTRIELYRESGWVSLGQNDDGNNRFFSAMYKRDLDPGVYYVRIDSKDTNVCADYYVSLDVFDQPATLGDFGALSNGWEMTWQGDRAFMYEVQYSSNIMNTQGWVVATNIEGIIGQHRWVDDGSVTVPGPNAATQRFYRVVTK
jgi:subtilisin family serine protease